MILATAAIASKYWHKLMGAAIQARSEPTTSLLAPPPSAPVNARTGSLYSNIRVGRTTGAPVLIRKERIGRCAETSEISPTLGPMVEESRHET